MAEKQRVASKKSPSKRTQGQETSRGAGANGHEDDVAKYEQELAGYLQERIKPGLNSGAIPLLARSIAKEIAHREPPNGASADAEAEDEQRAEADDEPRAEVEDEPSADADDEQDPEADDEPSADADDEQDAEANDQPSAEADDDEAATAPDFEADMHELQAELGKDWILRFSVQGDNAWLTAEKDDGSQRVEAPTAAVILEAVEVLSEGGGRPG